MHRINRLGLMMCLLGACHSAPTESAPIGGTFSLVRWNTLAVPVDLGFTPPGNCGRQVTTGALTLDVQRQAFSLSIQIVNCHGFDEGSSKVDGTYVQSGSALDFMILPMAGGSGYTHFYGTIYTDRIVVTDGATLEFKR